MEIKEDYCSFEVVKLLREKGFKKEEWCEDDWAYPTHAFAMKWLREIHRIHIDIIIEGNGCCIEYKAHIRPFNLIYPTRCFDSIDTIVVGRYNTYKEAVEAGLKHCLENLI